MDKPESRVAEKPQLLPRWLPWLHVALLVVTLFFWGSFLWSADLHGYIYKRDFASVYVGTRAVAEGRGSQLYELETQRSLMDSAILPYHRYNLLPYIYPAYVAVLLSPLGKLSLDEAFLVWTGLNFLATGWIAREWTKYFSRSFVQRVAILAAFFAWVPLQLTLSHGQLGLLCTLGLTQFIVSMRGGNPWRAGSWLALCLPKPQILILPLLALLLWRCWRTLAAFLGVLLIVLGISVAKLGFWFDTYSTFIVNFNGQGAKVSLYPKAMQNWRGLVACLLGSDTSFSARLLLGVLSIASLIVVVLVCRRRSVPTSGPPSSLRLPCDWEARFGVVILLGILASPYLYFHDWVVALPALIVLFCAARDVIWKVDGRHKRLATALLWLVGLAPFVCFAAQFDLSYWNWRIQLVPWYMAFLTIVAVLALQNGSQETT